MNAPIKSPCAECKRGDKDKNDDTCTNCPALQQYVASLGRPWEPVSVLRVIETKPKKEVKPVSDGKVKKYYEAYGTTKPIKEEPVITRTEPDVPKIKKEKPKEKYCPACGDTWTIESFTIDKTKPDGRARTCRRCKNEAQKKYRKTALKKKQVAKIEAEKAKPKYTEADRLGIIDPPLPTPADDICDAIERTVGQVYSDDFLSIDMAGHGDVLDRLTELAIKELRSVEMQALFILREFLKN